MNTTIMNPDGAGTPPEPSSTSAERTKRKEYKLVPVTQPMPKRVEKLLLKSLRMQARAGSMYAEAEELLHRALAETRGSSREKCLVPGVVYRFSAPAAIDNKVKSTVQIVDNFAQPEVTAVKVIRKYSVKTWKGDGPKADREDRVQALAGEEMP
jgi:hypothetical protein